MLYLCNTILLPFLKLTDSKILVVGAGKVPIIIPHIANLITNRKFRVPRKQGAHFLGARAQIQDPWVFSSLA
jgi:hypothetical protein